MRWIFCIIAVAVQPVFSYVVYRKQDKRQAALKMPMLCFSGAYLVAQFFVFFKYCIKFPEKYQIYAYLIQGAILAVFLVVECLLLFSNRHIERVEKQEQDSLWEFRQIQDALEVKKVLIKNADKIVQLDRIYEKMRYADPMSSPNVAWENAELMRLVEQLDDGAKMTVFEEQCNRILELLEIRKIKNKKVGG